MIKQAGMPLVTPVAVVTPCIPISTYVLDFSGIFSFHVHVCCGGSDPARFSQRIYTLSEWSIRFDFCLYRLIIGSVAGVAFMNMEHISFIWYIRNATPIAVLGYVAGIMTFLLQDGIG